MRTKASKKPMKRRRLLSSLGWRLRSSERLLSAEAKWVARSREIRGRASLPSEFRALDEPCETCLRYSGRGIFSLRRAMCARAPAQVSLESLDTNLSMGCSISIVILRSSWGGCRFALALLLWESLSSGGRCLYGRAKSGPAEVY